MTRTSIVLIVGAVLCNRVLPTSAEETRNAPPALSITTPTPQQFEALPLDAVLEINGERVTKREFLARRQRAYDATIKSVQEARARAEAEFVAHRRIFFDAQEAKLRENNQKVQAEIDRLIAADNAAHGPGWQTRKRQAADLLQQAAKESSPHDREQLEKRAADLLGGQVRP